MATYVNNLRLMEIATGDESGTWGTKTNTNLELIADAFGSGTEAITDNADTHTTTIADGLADEGRAIFLKYTGNLDSNCTITLAPNTINKLWFIENATGDSGASGPYSIIISQGSGANITIGNGKVAAVYTDGAADSAAVIDAFADLELSSTLTVAGTLSCTGVATFADDIVVGPTDKIFLDNGGNTYIHENSADSVQVVAGGTATLTVNSAGIVLPATSKLWLDSGGNTYIHENSADSFQVVAGATASLTVNSGGIIVPATNKIWLDNGGDTYILESAADTISLVAGGTTSVSATATGTSFNDLAITNVGDIKLDSISSDAATSTVIYGGLTAGPTELDETITNGGLWIQSKTGSSAGLAIGVRSDSEPYLEGTFSDGSAGRWLHINKYSGAGVYVTALNCSGAMSKGSGSFRIPHPLPDKNDTHDLVHSFIEGPRADLIYRGSVALSGGWIQVDLDDAAGMTEGTWELLCRDPQCWIQNDSGWAAVRGSVEGSVLTIDCADTDSVDTVSWMVVAERQDDHMKESSIDWTDDDGRPILEPLKLASDDR